MGLHYFNVRLKHPENDLNETYDGGMASEKQAVQLFDKQKHQTSGLSFQQIHAIPNHKDNTIAYNI